MDIEFAGIKIKMLKEQIGPTLKQHWRIIRNGKTIGIMGEKMTRESAELQCKQWSAKGIKYWVIQA